MKRCDLDALIATSPVSVTYFSDYYLWMSPIFKQFMMDPGASSDLDPSYAVLPRKSDPALLVDPMMKTNAVESWMCPPCDDRLVKVESSGDSVLQSLIEAIRTRGLSEADIGLEMDGMPPKDRLALARTLPKIRFRDCSNLIRLIRMVKSEEELHRLERAAQIAEDAGAKSLALAVPGRPVQDLVQAFRADVAQQGADLDHFAFSIRGAGLATEPDYILPEDESLFIDFGCIYRYYFSDTGTTLVMGKLTQRDQDKHKIIVDSVIAGAEAMQPGVKASQVHQAMIQVLRRSSLTTEYAHGHGLGLEVRDYPILVADNEKRIRDECVDVASDLPLEEGMVLNLESPLYYQQGHALHVERTFVVTENGARPLVEQDRSMPWVCEPSK